MFPRTPRIYVPYSCISSLKIHRNCSSKLRIEKNERLLESPYIWSSCASYLCASQGSSIVRKLDVDALVRKNVIDLNKLMVYSNVNKEYLIPLKAKYQPHHVPNGQDKMYNGFFKFSSSLYFNSAIHADNNAYISNHLQRYGRSVLRKTNNFNKDSGRNKDVDLPSDTQLDEMMIYFENQAHHLFTATGWSYNKCSYKIIFENAMLGTKTESLNAYILQINTMKNLTRLVLSNPELTIVRMTKNNIDGAIHIRWQVQGIPRHLKPFSIFGIIDEKRFIRYIDGFSVFYVKSDGLYHRHILLKMTPLRNESRKSLSSQILASFGFRSPELDGVPKQPVFPTFQDNGK